MYPEQSSQQQQQQYHPPPPPPHHHHVGMPPPATHFHHPPQAHAPYYEQDPSWRNNGGVGLGENQVDQSSCHIKLGEEGDARYSQ